MPAAFRDLSSVDPALSSARRKIVSVIGIDAYAHAPRLERAVGDALGVQKLLVEKLGFEAPISPLLDGKATKSAIERLVKDELRRVSRPEDALVLMFAGHGATEKTPFGKTGYLVPVEATSAGEFAELVNMDHLLDDISKLPAHHILVILDACHSGIALGSLQKTRSMEAYARDLDKRRSRRVMTSAMGDQLALDSGPVPNHSLFTGTLIQGLSTGDADLDGNGIITTSELALYVQRTVAQFPRSAQTPDFGAFHLDDRGELIFSPAERPAPLPRPTARATPGSALRAFLGYAPADVEAAERVSGQLAALRAEGAIAGFDVGAVGADGDWDEGCRAKLRSADVIVLVSSDALSGSRGARSEVVVQAVERHRAKQALVLPFLLTDCDWQDEPFGGLSPLPMDGRPLRSWEDEAEGFRVAARGLRDAVMALNAARGSLGAAQAGRSRSDQVKEVMQHLGKATCDGVALLGPLGFDAHELAGEVLERLRRPGEKLFPVRLLPDRHAADEETFYDRLLRDLRRPLPREWRGIVDGRSERRAVDRFANALEDLCEPDGPVARAGLRLLLAVDGLPFVEARQLEAWGQLMGRLLGEGLSMLVWGGQELRELRTRPASEGRFSAFQKLLGIDVRRYSAEEVFSLVRARGGGEAAGAAVFEETGGHPALVRGMLEMHLEEVLAGDREALRVQLLRSEHVERLRRTLAAESEGTRGVYRELLARGGTMGRRMRPEEERLYWLGVVFEDGPRQWRIVADVMRMLEVGA